MFGITPFKTKSELQSRDQKGNPNSIYFTCTDQLFCSTTTFQKTPTSQFRGKMINIHNHYHELLLHHYLDKIIMEQTNLNETQHHAEEVSPIEQHPEYPSYPMTPPMLARGKILNQ